MLFQWNFKISLITLVVISPLLLSSCVPVAIVGGTAAAGAFAARDKGIGETITDEKIETAVKAKIYKISPEAYSDISVVVDRGNVLLSGSVNNQEWSSKAEQEAWLSQGVKNVDNNISVGNKLSVTTLVKDGAITSACRAALVGSRGVHSLNYKLKTMDGIVYVTGLAKSDEELEKALKSIQSVDGVKKVVSYAKVEG